MIPSDGRFVIVDEELGEGTASVTKTKEIYWQDNTSVLHPVGKQSDCISCGCDFPTRVAGKAVAAATMGKNFSCAMVPEEMKAGALLAAATPASAAKSGSPWLMWVLAGLGVLLGLALLFFCLRGGQTAKKDRKTRKAKGMRRHHEDDEERALEAASPTDAGGAPDTARAPLLPQNDAPQHDAPQLPPRVAPPVFVTPNNPSARTVVSPAGGAAAGVFERIDRDHDGVISREEWQRYAFDALDQNHDGTISAQEWQGARRA